MFVLRNPWQFVIKTQNLNCFKTDAPSSLYPTAVSFSRNIAGGNKSPLLFTAVLLCLFVHHPSTFSPSPFGETFEPLLVHLLVTEWFNICVCAFDCNINNNLPETPTTLCHLRICGNAIITLRKSMLKTNVLWLCHSCIHFYLKDTLVFISRGIISPTCTCSPLEQINSDKPTLPSCSAQNSIWTAGRWMVPWNCSDSPLLWFSALFVFNLYSAKVWPYSAFDLTCKS